MVCLVVLFAGVIAAANSAPEPSANLATQVQSLLADRCVSCHGPDKRKGGLRLDSQAAVVAGGATGPAVDLQKAASSLLLARVRGEGDEDRMPSEGEALTDAQILLLQRWIEAGAAWPTAAGVPPPFTEGAAAHWAYRPPVRTTPAGRGSAIDAFIIERLQKEGLQLSPAAPRETLLRRASLDLIGLPPSLAELDAFVRDKRPDAWARQVDRLLASAHFGERWARWWLDLARYADSNGYEKDKRRVAWKYRDWVIDALNANMSWKQFTIEQLAGDMLPGATERQRIATGFHRNTLINQEGGVDPEEAFFETLVDRVGTTASVWLGTTLACAQCHNHKFDPISQKDFYKFMAFFSNGERELRGSLFGDLHMGEPMLPLPTPAQAAQRRALDSELAAVEAQIAEDSPEIQVAEAKWEDQQRQAEKTWQTLKVRKAVSQGGASLSVLADGSIVAGGKLPAGDVYEITAHTTLATITGVRLEVLGDKTLPKGGPGRGADGGFLLNGFDVKAAAQGQSVDAKPILFSTAGTDEQVSSFGPATLLRPSPEGWAIDVDAVAGDARRQAVFVLAEPAMNTTFVIRLSHVPRAQRSIGRFRLSVTGSADPLFITHIPRRDRALLFRPKASRTAADQAELLRVFRKNSNHFALQRQRITAIHKQVDDLGIATAMVLQERPGYERPSALMRTRGAFSSPGERVFADVPKALPPLPPEAAPNRLGLARWLVDEGNPLTARVTVNRFWEQLFGRGLLETSEDFGTQSPPPTHPELLDWLATEYMRLGWDTKALLRTIVMSDTYKQSSLVKPVHLDKDPANRLLARGPRFRMDAETLRDAALSTSGLLSAKMGGPSVFPWQPPGVWDVPYNETFTWQNSAGQDAHRRTLYTFLRRSAPYPFLINFDATSRETCALRRPRTNTPLQVLNTLNDPVFFKAAQALALRMMKEGGKQPEAWLAHGFRLVTSRSATAKEARDLKSLFNSQREQFAAHPKSAADVLMDPTVDPQTSAKQDVATPRADQAALTLVANVLLNLDEAITKE